VRSESVLTFVRAVPFRPFRLVLNSGRAYDVRHPEMVRVGRDTVIYFYETPPDAPFDRFEFVSLLLIERVEHLEVTTPS
jgi:hypothetical protein